MYKDDMQYIIDEKLDCITRFEDIGISGAQLRWFDNYGFRDVKLTYRLREIAVYITDGNAELLPDIIMKAKQDLSRHLQENKRIAKKPQFSKETVV